MEMSPEKYLNRMCELLDKKAVFMSEILGLTREQANSISEEGIEGLQRLIDAKQQRIEAIDKLDEEFTVYFQRLKSVLKVDSLAEVDASSISGAKEFKEKVAGIVECVQEIADVEKKNSLAASKLLESLGGEVRKLNQGMKMNNAYSAAKNSTASYFIDKKK